MAYELNWPMGLPGHMIPCPVDIWTVALEEPRETLLSPDERARADRFRFERDRVRWSNAHSALRSILARYLSQAPLELRFTTGPHGKPATDGLQFNLSHAGAWAMVAVSREAPVGIDIEAIRENVDIAKLLVRIGETEVGGSRQDLFRIWARREARTKATGSPLMEMPTADLRVVDLMAPEGFAAALAMQARDPAVNYCGGV